jgi:pimeloyl-ACP methyl ester carboxylesterase
LVGHSSGGGLVQCVLDKGMCRAAGMVLVAAVPNFGSKGVYWNWFKTDPWFIFRSLVHLQHPRSPLSSTSLVQRAFFGHEFERQKVVEFEKWMPAYESLRWPIEMLKSGWIDASKVVANLKGWGDGDEASKIMIMAGDEDKLMGVQLMEDMARDYRWEVQTLAEKKKLDVVTGQDHGTTEPVKGTEENSEAGVIMVVVKGAGHHIQNDVQAERAVEVFRRFLEGV